MDYSDRVNSKKGAGAVADRQESNMQTKRRIKELLTTQVLDLDRDPYVFRNHLGMLECRLCLTTHTNEASYISHLGGKKHGLNLERRRILDEKYNQSKNAGADSGVSLTNVAKRHWKPIGQPLYKITKVRSPETLKVGLLIQVQLPKITVKEPFFRLMSFFELSQSNQGLSKEFLLKKKSDIEEDEDLDPGKWQYLVVSAEPYENVAISFPAKMHIDKPAGDEMSDSYWWVWDADSKELFVQLLFN